MTSIILKKNQENDAIHKRCREDSRFEGNPQNSCLSKKIQDENVIKEMIERALSNESIAHSSQALGNESIVVSSCSSTTTHAPGYDEVPKVCEIFYATFHKLKNDMLQPLSCKMSQLSFRFENMICPYLEITSLMVSRKWDFVVFYCIFCLSWWCLCFSCVKLRW